MIALLAAAAACGIAAIASGAWVFTADVARRTATAAATASWASDGRRDFQIWVGGNVSGAPFGSAALAIAGTVPQAGDASLALVAQLVLAPATVTPAATLALALVPAGRDGGAGVAVVAQALPLFTRVDVSMPSRGDAGRLECARLAGAYAQPTESCAFFQRLASVCIKVARADGGGWVASAAGGGTGCGDPGWAPAAYARLPVPPPADAAAPFPAPVALGALNVTLRSVADPEIAARVAAATGASGGALAGVGNAAALGGGLVAGGALLLVAALGGAFAAAMRGRSAFRRLGL